MTNRWIASYEMADDGDYLEHYGRVGMKWGQHIFAKDPAAGRKYIDKKRKALSANVALAKDAARRGNAKRLAQLNKKTKKMVADVKQLEEMYEQATGQKYSSSKPGEAEDAVTETKQTSKESILKTGSAKDVFAIKDQLTQSELQDAINRIQKETYLEDLKTKEKLDKINKVQNYVNTAINAGHTAVNAFNTYEQVAKMVNNISGEDTLPIFTGRKEKAENQAYKERTKKVNEIIKRGDPIEIYENLHLLTNDEVTQATKRLTNKGLIEKKVIEAYERTLAAEEEMKHSEDFVDFLCHHGRPGQKWGEHNGPPYPLDRKSVTKGYGKKAKVAKSASKNYSNNSKIKGKTTAKSYTKQITDKDVEDFIVGITHLTAPNERFWRESIKADDLSRIMNVAEGLKTGELSHLKRLDRPGGRINDDDLGTVNFNRNHRPKDDPDAEYMLEFATSMRDYLRGTELQRYDLDTSYGRNQAKDAGFDVQLADTIADPGLNNNCGKCSASLFLRSLGYDVQAGRSAHGVSCTAGEYWFDGAVPYKEKSIENLEKRMASFGHQGKGMLGCRRADGSGHSIYFQNEKGDDGKWSTVIYDGQIGRKYNSVKELFDAESFDDTQFSRVTNLTNATPNWDHLAEDSVSRVNYKNKSLNVVQNINTGNVYDANKLRFT